MLDPLMTLAGQQKVQWRYREGSLFDPAAGAPA
jgi:hypothetical protein